jgi:hypothetical protein
MNNKDALNALMNIEGFRSLNSDIETIINKSEAVKKAKKEGDEKLTPKEKKELTDEEKEFKSMRKQIQEKLIKFATRIPVFMYLTDYRERSLKPRTEQTTTLGCGNKNLHDVIAALIPDYKPKMRYKVVGEFDAENRVIYYDMSAAEVSEFRAVKD